MGVPCLLEKGVEVIRWVITPTRQSLASSRKRTLRSRSAMAARSVWSGGRSRVIESRNVHYCWSLLIRNKGGSIEQAKVSPSKKARQAKVCATRPGSESRADACVDNPGTREIPESPPENRIGAKPVKQSPGSVLVSGHRRAKTDRSGGIAERAPSEAGERDRGSLSTLIVPYESRETPSGRSL